MNDIQRSEIRKRLEAVDPWPWDRSVEDDGYIEIQAPAANVANIAEVWSGDANAEFIEFAPSDISALLEEVDQLRAHNETLLSANRLARKELNKNMPGLALLSLVNALIELGIDPVEDCQDDEQ